MSRLKKESVTASTMTENEMLNDLILANNVITEIYYLEEMQVVYFRQVQNF